MSIALIFLLIEIILIFFPHCTTLIFLSFIHFPAAFFIFVLAD